MKFEPNIQSEDLCGIVISHGDEVVNFNLRKNNGKRSWSNLPSVFNAVNNLFQSLSVEEQEQMFNVYSNIYELTMHKVGGDNFDSLVDDLREYIVEIFSLLPLDGILNWSTGSYSDFAIPETIGEATTVGNYPPSTSYNHREYLELCGLSTAFKLVLPITFEFMKEFKDVFGTEFKEYNMMHLFTDLDLASCPPFAKLLTQAEDKLMVRGEIEVPMGLLLQGIGASQYALFSIATDVIRTLCLSETDVHYRIGGVPNNITAKLTKAISSKIEGNKNKFSYTNTEIPREKSGGEAGNTTLQETSNTIQRFSDLYGRFFIKEFSRPDFHKRHKIPGEVHVMFHKHVQIHKPMLGDDSKRIIVSMCFPKFANIEALTLVPKNVSRLIIANTAAYLHHLKLHGLVNFILAKEDLETSDSQWKQSIGADAKPDKELLALARQRYAVNNGGGNGFEEGLKELVSNICSKHWIKMSPTKLHESYDVNTPYIVDRNFKNEIAMLAIAGEI